jgi:hypothetical protein
MSYIINKTDGSILSTVADGQLDQLSSDLTLVGKNYSGFGEALNENFIKLLENFANTVPPSRPIKGQIWFDGSESKLKVYNGSSFVPVSSATISNTQPSTLGVGDLWFDNVNKQLFFFDGTNTILLGPSYSASQGRSGLIVSTILDSLNQTRVITTLYDNGSLLGIFSKDSFTPKQPIIGFSGSIIAGFNAGTISGFKFNVTATNSEQLGNEPAASYLRKNADNIINGQLTVVSNSGVLIGDSQQAQIFVDNGTVSFVNNSKNNNISIKVKRGDATDIPFDVDTINQTLKLYGSNPGSEVIVGGNLTVNGNLTVAGDSVTINASTLTVEDKAIELAKQTGITPTDANANGGGVILKGASDKTFLWTIATSSWNSSEDINLAYGKKLKVNGVEVISGTALGAGITSIPGVTSFGTQSSLVVGPVLPDDNTLLVDLGSLVPSGNPPTPTLRIDRNRISTIITNRDVEIAPNGTGNVALKQVTGIRYIDQVTVGNPRITGMGDPLALQDAATKNYVDTVTQSRPLVFSMDISDAISNAGIAGWLTQVAPPGEYRNGTVARILCTSLSNSSTTINMNSYVTAHPTEFITPDAPGSLVPGGTAFGVDNVSFTPVTVSPQVVSVYRVVKVYQVITGAWTFVA